ncbi:molybdopterin biosynthesis protein [Carboxydothermus pertinax]|uniref:Molybdopterin molybdenumtransferase n=1 Tax=Carboxydothermus pertinax TaxID=870242 RepID=A0A1L8CUI2_9THEO|nr:molybdopterin biosynthesis protein [Carboxydothermus pertinax]GAV22615.1 molybdopterin biosynthesis protein [Carboxydothermus pertinax]
MAFYLNQVPFEEAWENFESELLNVNFFHPREEEIETVLAVGRITAKPVLAHRSNPHYNASAVDGFAVKAKDTFYARETSPVLLKPGENCLRVDTGDLLPEGYDAVIMVEDVFYPEPGVISIIKPVTPGTNVRFIGEDFNEEEVLLPAFAKIKPADVGALLAGGVKTLKVLKKLKALFIPTGDEIVPITKAPEPGQIPDTNSSFIKAVLAEYGYDTVIHSIVKDDPELLYKAVKDNLDLYDVIIINAGSSAGRDDYAAQVIERLGRVLVHGLATKPGKPAILGIAGHKPIIGLPGFPLSGYLICELILKPLAENYYKTKFHDFGTIRAVLTKTLVSTTGVDDFVWGKVSNVAGRYCFTPLSRGASVSSTLLKTNALLRIPRFSEGYKEGMEIEINLKEPLAEVDQYLTVTGSHDLLLDLIDSFLREKYGIKLSSSHVGSLNGIVAIEKNYAKLAGVHLLDPATGDYNQSYVEKRLKGYILINLSLREQGLIVARGNPRKISGLADLVKSGVTFVNRQKGSGTRVFLDYLLNKEKINPRQISGYEREEYTHLAVAAKVKNGLADCGLGIYAAAKIFDLDFIPLGEERYDLLLREENLEDPQVKKLLEVITSEEFKKEVERIGGYKTTLTGQIVGKG